MPRPVVLFSGPFADLPLDVLAARAAEWGYAGLEVCCWGDHLEVQHGLSDDAYAPARLELLARHDLQVPVVANHKVGQAVSDVIDRRHQALLPDYVWGDGQPAAVAQRAAEEMAATFRLAERLGAGVVSGFTGSAQNRTVSIVTPVVSAVSVRPGAVATHGDSGQNGVSPHDRTSVR